MKKSTRKQLTIIFFNCMGKKSLRNHPTKASYYNLIRKKNENGCNTVLWQNIKMEDASFPSLSKKVRQTIKPFEKAKSLLLHGKAVKLLY